MSLRRLLPLLLIALVLAPATALGAAVGRWQRLTPITGDGLNAPALGRTVDGNLHVSYKVANGTTDVDFWDQVVTPAGALLAPAPIVQHFYILGDRAPFASLGTGLVSYFGGRVADQGVDGTFVTAGPPFTSPTTPIHGSADSDFAYAPSNPVATTASDGTPFYAYSATGQLRVQRGTVPGPTYNFTTPANQPDQAYDPEIAADGVGGAVWLTWYSLGTPNRSIWLQGVDPASGAPLGRPTALAASPGLALDSGQSLALSGRGVGHPGVYAAYWDTTLNVTRLLVRPAGGQPFTVAKGSSTYELARPALSHDSAGRLWLAYVVRGYSAQPIVVRRSNVAGTRFGAPVRIAPADARHFSSYSWLAVNGERSDGVLDVVVRRTGIDSRSADWQARVYAGLGLKASRSSVRAGSGGRVTFTVDDAGDAVKGASVKLSGPGGARSGKTGASGTVTLTLPAGRRGTWRVRASHALYVSASMSIRAR
jgi:hypothetical protein